MIFIISKQINSGVQVVNVFTNLFVVTNDMIVRIDQMKSNVFLPTVIPDNLNALMDNVLTTIFVAQILRMRAIARLQLNTVDKQNLNVETESALNCPKNGTDETNCQIELCSVHEFECEVDGKCISGSLRCDSYYDCSDYSDEQNCETRLCRLSQFKCGTGLCIDRALVCNGVADCPDRICLSGQYICANGQCIDMSRRCDGIANCNDNSDEMDCITNDINIQVYPERQNIRQGQEVVFRCREESEKRLPVQWGRPDGQPLPYGSTDVRGRLTIPNIQPQQSGVYICSTIASPLGSRGAQRAAVLTVQPLIY
ncbi:unnamed protein product [Medioppia subpectinata]|uniref:Ig-like domain-containing protein n=1 Tax=Medioppia subpectinata TaxID=1979941 RepID=A0A7R9KSE8_9ACAR|nr:unnamed protein product [Medioppia subpectinata]CAG2108665.1 unnamed protein product [Medioppia subpectinata]